MEAPVELGDLRISSTCEDMAPHFISHNGEELESKEFMPFGETVSLFDECFIGDERIFSQQDATIRLSFRLSAREKLLSLTVQQEEDSLKIIKRKPRMEQTIASSSPQRVSLEYYNGTGWRKLSCSDEFAFLLDGNHPGDYTLSFPCPADWSPLPVAGYEGRSLRLRVMQADNCYLLPCRHTMPVLQDFQISYTYDGAWKQPQKLTAVCGTQVEDLTQPLLEGKRITALHPLPYPPAALYLGFDRPLSGAPISLLFDVEENAHFSMPLVSFQYSSRTGFKPLKVLDGTRNFSGAGTVVFMPPSDFAPLEAEGRVRWWIRLCAEESGGYHARVRSMALNAVEIRNQETLGEESFYVEASAPDMTFPLAAENILSAELFVSEMAQLSRSAMERLLAEQPDNVRVEYDFLGDITSFFVRWTEVENFDRSKPGDRHYILNRMNNTIVFGDGVHVRIPQSQHGVAFTVRCVCCDGERGNVPPGAVNRFFANVLYADTVQNPIATYAGSNLESVDSARQRGANLFNSHARLVSELDYVRAVKAFSASIEKVKCIAGLDIDGHANPDQITIAVMTKDYRDGAYSFNNIRDPLKQRLLTCCAATVAPESLVLSEPIYVELSVDVWAKVDSAAHAFEVQSQISESIQRFLDPLDSTGHRPWAIGVLPSESQLRMLLQSLRFHGHISRFIVVARYTDAQGVHETGLDHLPNNPFAIGVNGTHRVYTEFQ